MQVVMIQQYLLLNSSAEINNASIHFPSNFLILMQYCVILFNKTLFIDNIINCDSILLLGCQLLVTTYIYIHVCMMYEYEQ